MIVNNLGLHSPELDKLWVDNLSVLSYDFSNLSSKRDN
jgi:hypothetical protein